MPPISSLALAFVAGLALLMPVNYRARADHVHAHSTFQIWIDAATGHLHHHDRESGRTGQRRETNVVSIPDPVGPIEVFPNLVQTRTDYSVLSTIGSTENGSIVGDAPASQQPDAPHPITTLVPIQDTRAMQALGVLIAFLLAGSARRLLWVSDRRLAGIASRLEPPPPRLTPC